MNKELKHQIVELITPGSSWSYSGNMSDATKVIEYTAEQLTALFDSKIIPMKADIEYAIGYCQGLGHPCSYLESRYPQSTTEEEQQDDK
jgi:hypothetical protein